MRAYVIFLIIGIIITSLLNIGVASAAQAARTTTSPTGHEEKILLGKSLFMDSNLSEPAGQSCASCHSFGAGFADPDRNEATSRGLIPNRFGSRNSPMIAYAKFIPPFHYNEKEGLYVGGLFLDGRAINLEEQARQPFLNKVEMNNPDEATVARKVSESGYSGLFKKVYGDKSLDNPKEALDNIANAIAAFERTSIFAPFSAKYDLVQEGKAMFTAQEQRGFELFKDEKKGNCAACHPVENEDGRKALFTDFTYDNLGIPKNLLNPFNVIDKEFNPDGMAFVDKGLGSGQNTRVAKEYLAEQVGKFRVPSLRNIALTAPYGHNGVFKTLKEITDFYNSRDVVGEPGHVETPEVADNVNKEELGDLKLTEQEVLDIVAFMETLTDGYVPEKSADNDNDELKADSSSDKSTVK